MTDWDAIDDSIGKAARTADAKLVGREAKLRLSEDEKRALCPTEADTERLQRLMAIVQASTHEAERVNALVKEIQDLGPLVLRLLTKFAV